MKKMKMTTKVNHALWILSLVMSLMTVKVTLANDFQEAEDRLSDYSEWLKAWEPASGSGEEDKEGWNSINNPFSLNSQFSSNFRQLPTSGAISFAPWSDSYWPSYEGGIAYRWYNSASEYYRLPFNRYLLSDLRIRSMPINQLATLSPAEKYDIYMGDFTYPTVKRELRRTGRNAQRWEGICHGWAPATLNFPEEPMPIVLTGPSGIPVPFGASDIKALLSYYQGELSHAPTAVLGSRCDGKTYRHSMVSSACRDVNPGAFHIILTNLIGPGKQSFVADLSAGKEVWNYPIYSYNTRVTRFHRYPSRWAAQGTASEIEVRTDLVFSVETSSHWQRNGHSFNQKSLYYTLELDRGGNIIGGDWLSSDHPDFVWVQARPVFTGYFAEIENIYNLSIHQ